MAQFEDLVRQKFLIRLVVYAPRHPTVVLPSIRLLLLRRLAIPHNHSRWLASA